MFSILTILLKVKLIEVTKISLIFVPVLVAASAQIQKQSYCAKRQ